VQVSRHAPGNRFITLFCGIFTPLSGELRYVSAGHTPPLVIKSSGATERLADGGIALGMFTQSAYATGRTLLEPGDVLAVYSDGITEAENRDGKPFDERGLEAALPRTPSASMADLAQGVFRAVEGHAGDVRLADDLTILLLRRLAVAAV
jgi:sigma-B regulation protein RsbU (phosphoserine phosphatase)